MLNTDDITKILINNKRTSISFRGVYACDKLPKNVPTSSLYVCNTDPSTLPGEHWIVIYIDSKKRADFFDSFGMHPSVKIFETFLNNNSVVWSHSNKVVQHPFSDACGYHCIFFAFHRCLGFNMNAIVNMYTNNLMYNDAIVKEFIREKVVE
jgi:hypothetical protein